MKSIDQNIKSERTFNRAEQRSNVNPQYQKKSISIVDVDTAILQYLEKSNLYVLQSEVKKQVPIIYGSPERWKQASKNGYIKDQKGRIQIPLILFRRTNMSRANELINKFNKNQRITYVSQWSQKNRYDKFNEQIGLEPTKELYKVRLGDFMLLDYEFVIWTDFVSHTNQLIEQLNWNSDEYWGIDGGPKFKSTIDNFSTTTEVMNGEDRMVQTIFTLQVRAYLFPEIDDSQDDESVIRSYTKQKKVIFTETVSGLDDLTKPSEIESEIVKERSFNKVNQIGALYPAGSFDLRYDVTQKNAEFESVHYYLSLVNTKQAIILSSNSVKLENTTLATPPMVSYIDLSQETKFTVSINSTFVTPNLYTYVDDGTDITIEFNESLLGYSLTSEDVVIVIGKLVDS